MRGCMPPCVSASAFVYCFICLCVLVCAAVAPKLSCSQTSAYLSDKNVHIKCEISAKPPTTSILWVIDANGTLLAEGQVVNGYWTIIMVRIQMCFLPFGVDRISTNETVTHSFNVPVKNTHPLSSYRTFSWTVNGAYTLRLSNGLITTCGTITKRFVCNSCQHCLAIWSSLLEQLFRDFTITRGTFSDLINSLGTIGVNPGVGVSTPRF